MKTLSLRTSKLIPVFAAVFVFVFVPISHAYALTFSPVRYELRADPGQTLEKEMILINETDGPMTYYSIFKNFEAEGETGIPSPTDSTTGLASWMYTEPSITIPPKTSAQIAFQVRVPKTAEPGGYFGMVLWSANPPSTDKSGELAIGAQTGPLVLLTVNGDIKESAGVSDFATKDKKHFYTSLPVLFTYRFRNDGNDRVKPVGDMHIKNIFGMTARSISANKVEGNVLPKSTRRFEVEWRGEGKNADVYAEKKITTGFFDKVSYEWHNFAFGHFKAVLSLGYGTTNERANEIYKFWIIPWHLLLVIFVILLFIYWTGRKVLRSYNRFIIRQATMALEQMEESRVERSVPTPREDATLDLKHKPTRAPRRRV